MEQTFLTTLHSSCICTFYHNGKAKVMVIDSVKTEEKYRQKGHATQLLHMALRLAMDRDVDSVELVVNEDNAAAKNLYWNLGFRKTNKEHHRIILPK